MERALAGEGKKGKERWKSGLGSKSETMNRSRRKLLTSSSELGLRSTSGHVAVGALGSGGDVDVGRGSTEALEEEEEGGKRQFQFWANREMYS